MDSIGASIDSLFPYILIPDKATFGRRLPLPKGHALINRRLYPSKDWTGALGRLTSVHVLKDLRFATKLAIAAAMVRQAVGAEAPFTWMAANSIGGLGELEMALRRAGKGYALGVTGSHHFISWSPAPVSIRDRRADWQGAAGRGLGPLVGGWRGQGAAALRLGLPGTGRSRSRNG